MSMPDKANYVLYSIIYIAVGFFILRGFFKISGSSKNFPRFNEKINLTLLHPRVNNSIEVIAGSDRK